MARMKRNVGDYVSGKLGNVVFVQKKGKSYVRAAPHRKTDNWTSLQQMYRKRMSNISRLWRSIRFPLIKDAWKYSSQEMTGYAVFLQKNTPAFTIAGELMDPCLIFPTWGKLYMPPLQFEYDPFIPAKMSVQWQNDPNMNPERLKDALMVMSYENGIFSIPMDSGIQRGNGGGIVDIPTSKEVTDPGHVYVFFVNKDETQFSVSSSFRL